LAALQRRASGTTLNGLRLALGAPCPHHPIPFSPNVLGVTAATFSDMAMKTERFADHNQAREALVLSVASVTATMLTAYLILLILY
jgi:hypothetical protein